MIDADKRVLLELAQSGLAEPWRGLFALRADGLSRQQFHKNRRTLKAVRRDILKDHPSGSGLGSSLEMERMTFVSLGVLEDACKKQASSRVLEV